MLRMKLGQASKFLIFLRRVKSEGISWELIEMEEHEAVDPWRPLRDCWLVAMTTWRILSSLMISWGRQGRVRTIPDVDSDIIFRAD